MFTLEELRNFGIKELEEELRKARLEGVKLKLQHSSNQLKETHKLKLYRKYVARLNTMKRYNMMEAVSKKPKD